MNLICSENISLCDCEDKREVMEKDNEAVVLDMNIKIADAVKPRVGADVNDAVTLDEIKDMKNVFDIYNKRRVGDLYGVESNISELGTTDAKPAVQPISMYKNVLEEEFDAWIEDHYPKHVASMKAHEDRMKLQALEDIEWDKEFGMISDKVVEVKSDEFANVVSVLKIFRLTL
ncbi:hypothetical protein Tco_0595421 [Tanacetum coccineum]